MVYESRGRNRPHSSSAQQTGIRATSLYTRNSFCVVDKLLLLMGMPRFAPCILAFFFQCEIPGAKPIFLFFLLFIFPVK